MSSPLTTSRNPYWDNPKNSVVYTPDAIAKFLFKIVDPIINPKVVLDPAIGQGALVKYWRSTCRIVGVDIDPACQIYADEFICSRFEDIKMWTMHHPDLVVCNPPFNGAGRNLYPELFLRNILNHFGPRIPLVLFAPMGFRLNQRKKSGRWQWVRDNGPEISSIVSLPLDAFDGVLIHSEILLFNIGTAKAHYWLDSRYLAA